jgi:hypothetical protein
MDQHRKGFIYEFGHPTNMRLWRPGSSQ